MSDIELVIKIPETVYNALTHTEFDANLVVVEMRKAITDGTPLPEGHGRLIDADKLYPDSDYEDGVFYAVSVGQIGGAETIIEAESEG